jgi:hypothetical protein
VLGPGLSNGLLSDFIPALSSQEDWVQGTSASVLHLPPFQAQLFLGGLKQVHALPVLVPSDLRFPSELNKPDLCSVHSVHQLGLTSICIREFSSPQETQVACSGPDGLGVTKTQPRVEVIRLEGFISINGKITTGVVGAVDPDL